MYEYEKSMFYGLKSTMNAEQDAYVRAILGTPVVFANAKAGTGKTLLAYASLHFLKTHGVIDKIYYIFSPVEEGKMGFRPGTQQEKSLDYASPLVRTMTKLNINPHFEMADSSQGTELVPHTFLRGDTKERSGIIYDEAQNYTLREFKKALTRPMDDCHLVAIGHEAQIDLLYPEESGFMPYLHHFGKLPEDKVKVCQLTKNYRGWIANHADALFDPTMPVFKPTPQVVTGEANG